MIIEDLWHPYPEETPVRDGGEYILTWIVTFDYQAVRLAKWTTCLEKVDKAIFKGMRRPGFYSYDSEYGYYEVDDVTAWMPAPRPFMKGDK